MSERLCEAAIAEDGLPNAGVFVVDDPRKAFALVGELEKRMKQSELATVDGDIFLATMDEFGKIELQVPRGTNLFVLARFVDTKAREFTALAIFAEMQKGKQIVTPKMGGQLKL